EQPPPLRTIDATIPDPIEQVILRMLVKNPEQRLQSMDEFGNALDAFTQNSLTGVRPAPVLTPPPSSVTTQRTPGPVPPPQAPQQPERTTLRGTASEKVPKTPGKRSKLGISLAIFGGLAVAAGAVAVATGGGSSNQPQVASLQQPGVTPPADPKPEPPKP